MSSTSSGSGRPPHGSDQPREPKDKLLTKVAKFVLASGLKVGAAPAAAA